MTNDSRTPKGVPAGGEFASRQRADASVELAPEATAAAFAPAARAARNVEVRAIAADIRTRTHELFPDAARVAFTRNMYGQWSFDHVMAADGTPLTAPGGQYYDDQPNTYKLNDALQPLADQFGTRNSAQDAGVMGDDNVIHFTDEPSARSARERLLELDVLAEAVQAAQHRARVELVSALVVEQWPTAKTVFVSDHALEPDQKSYLFTTSIVDAFDVDVWDSATGELGAEADYSLSKIEPQRLAIDTTPGAGGGAYRIDI
jgi:hypothetical protein